MLPDDVQDFVSSAVAGDTDALQALLALSTNAATSDAARRELSSLLERQLASAASHCAEAWMLLATLHEAAGETQSALRSWYHSAQPHAKRNAARMQVLGIDTEASWTSRAAQIRKMRAEYLRDAFRIFGGLMARVSFSESTVLWLATSVKPASSRVTRLNGPR